MFDLLAIAEPGDSSLSGLTLIIIGVGIVLVVFAAAFVPVAIGWSRRSRRSDAIVLGAVVWGMLAAASLVSTAMTQMKWSREKTLRIESGYYDPNDTTDEPQLPWIFWAILIGIYVALFVWPLAGARGRPMASR